ncbi:hypothetical protein EYF80_034888 [Liparis tanakae]|uniref:Uncharacterized protein n=1 Tax=Liparis tanakae TaxID=230148 RepID=A0A4Z2GMK3_9TELE|nr:hypothetical protein EYF80_034888 [Liparis tanakae]
MLLGCGLLFAEHQNKSNSNNQSGSSGGTLEVNLPPAGDLELVQSPNSRHHVDRILLTTSSMLLRPHHVPTVAIDISYQIIH